VGGSQPIEVDVRVVAATHRDLRSEVEDGRFREDLLFRLDVVPLKIPPLRERTSDIPALVEHAMVRLRRRHGLPAPRLNDQAMEALRRYPWPGNVRELLNLVERLAILHAGESVGADRIRRVLPESSPPSGPVYRDDDDRPLRDRLDDYERVLLSGALDAADGNVAEAGRRLRTDRANLYRRMKRLGLRNDD
jgi:two-component system nitrogen regulation response regulator NtrX